MNSFNVKSNFEPLSMENHFPPLFLHYPLVVALLWALLAV